MKFPITITLKDPITRCIKDPRVIVSELKIERPLKAKDLKNIPATASDTDRTLIVIGRLTDQPLSVIDELSMDDLAAVSATLEALRIPDRFLVFIRE
jgi:hypothetical protein